jgi:hypothetical protein
LDQRIQKSFDPDQGKKSKVVTNSKNGHAIHVNSSDVVKTTGCGKHNDNESQSDKDGSRILLHDDEAGAHAAFGEIGSVGHPTLLSAWVIGLPQRQEILSIGRGW